MGTTSQAPRIAAASLLVGVLATALTGCQFLGDVVEGQRLSSERLAVDGALRQLTAEIEKVALVESADYDFDAGDVASTPTLRVELSGTEFASWHEVASRIEEAAADDSMRGYPVAVTLDSPTVGSWFDSQYGASWLSEDALRLAADAASAFPESHADVSGASSASAYITVSTHEPAEQLLDRLADDPRVVELSERATAGGHWLSLSADGLEVTGAPSPAVAQWTRGVLASDVPRLTMTAEPTLDEWVVVSLSVDGSSSSISATWAGTSEPSAGGQAWDGFLAALRGGAPAAVGGGGCVPLLLSYSWPGAGGSAGAFASCGEPVPEPANPDRPALKAMRDALAAEGFVPEDLGFSLS